MISSLKQHKCISMKLGQTPQISNNQSPSFLPLSFIISSLILRLSFVHCSSFVRPSLICPCGSHRHLFVLPSSFVRLLFVFCSSFVRPSFICPCGSHRHLFVLPSSFVRLLFVHRSSFLHLSVRLAPSFI